MRISTSGMHYNALRAMLDQQATLSKTQTQIASGKRVQTPADDPVAAVRILELERALQESDQYKQNADIAQNRLTLEEQALADTGTVLHRVRELAVQANNATVDNASRRMIATELRNRLQELVDIANRRDANGEFLFAGYQTMTQPFVESGGSISYFGDQGGRLLQVGPNQRVGDSHSGYEVFLDVPQGNGTFVTGAASTNTGTAVIASGSLADPTQWQAEDYRLQFTSATGDYRIVDSSDVVVATGTYAAGDAISFRGVNLNFTGEPALNDEFTIRRSRTEDIFSTVERLVSALEADPITPSQRALVSTDIATTLQQLDETADHLLSVRAEVGARLSRLETAEAAREDYKVELQSMTSDLRDLDYAEAITRMNQQLLGLQAAQASYSQISQLSLFNYLK